MSGWEMLEAVGAIDAAFVQEADGTPAAGRLSKKRGRVFAVAACVAVAVAAAVFFAARRLPKVTLPPDEEGSVVYETPSGGQTSPGTSVAGPSASAPETETTGGAPEAAGSLTEPTENVSAPTETTAPPAVTEPVDGAGGVPTTKSTSSPENELAGGPPLPEQWSPAAPVAKGTGYTREEIDALLLRDGAHIAQVTALETGCATEDVRICRDGWRHTSLGEENCYDLDYLTLPVCVGETVVASVDLFRVDGEPRYSVSAGGPRWDNLNRALRYGEVAFAYAGFGELAVAADGTVFEITVDAAAAVAGIDDLYARAAASPTVFSQARLAAALSEAD